MPVLTPVPKLPSTALRRVGEVYAHRVLRRRIRVVDAEGVDVDGVVTWSYTVRCLETRAVFTVLEHEWTDGWSDTPRPQPGRLVAQLDAHGRPVTVSSLTAKVLGGGA